MKKTIPTTFFARKTPDITSDMTVGHLPMETSRVTEFLLDRRAGVFAFLTSTNYFISPLVQGGVKIPCRFEIHMAPTVRNKELV